MNTMTLFFGGLILLLLVVLIGKAISAMLHGALDYDSKASSVKRQIHADNASIAKSKQDKDLYEKETENNPLKVRLQKAQLEAQQAAARAAKRMADLAYDMGLDVETYRYTYQRTLEHQFQMELKQAEYLGLKDYEEFKAFLQLEMDKLRLENRVKLGFFMKKKERKLLKQAQKRLGGKND